MSISEEDFKDWLNDHGYDYETYQDDMVLWNEYLIIPSAYTQEQLMDDCWEFSIKTLDFEKVDSGYIKQQQIEEEFFQWKMENWRTFDLNATEMDLYYDFMEGRNNNALSGDA